MFLYVYYWLWLHQLYHFRTNKQSKSKICDTYSENDIFGDGNGNGTKMKGGNRKSTLQTGEKSEKTTLERPHSQLRFF